MLSAALVVGLAGGIIQILQDGRIIDPILHSMATLMGEGGKDCFPRSYVPDPDYDQYYYPFRFGEGGIDYADYGTILDVIGISRQATVLAFQFGDGFTNMITPTSGVFDGGARIGSYTL